MRDKDVEEEQEEENTENPDIILSEHLLEYLRRHTEDLKEFDKGFLCNIYFVS